MSAPQERGQSSPRSIPFSECTPETLLDVVKGQLLLDEELQEYEAGKWAAVDFGGGGCVEFHLPDRDSIAGGIHSWLELPDVNTRANPVFLLDDAEVIIGTDSLTFVAPFDVEESSGEHDTYCLTWVVITDRGYTLTSRSGRSWGSGTFPDDVSNEIFEAAQSAAAREQTRKVA